MSKKGNRVIVLKENDTRLLLHVINPEHELYSSTHVMARDEFTAHEKSGELSFVQMGLFNCDFSKLKL
jgi:hypothetical protein